MNLKVLPKIRSSYKFPLGENQMDENLENQLEKNEENKEVEQKDEITKLVGDFETISTIFNEPNNMLKDLSDSFGSKNYATILESSKNVLSLMEQPTKQFIKVGMAFSISAAAEWASPLGEVGVDITRVQELISEAKEQFTEGEYHKADETIGKVRDMIPKLEEEQKRAAQESITTTEEIIEKVRNTGASADRAETCLSQAKKFLEDENYQQVVKLTREAKQAAEDARDQRVQTVSDALLFTRSVIDESRGVGVDISEPDAMYKQAKTAFGKGDFVKCSELTKEAEDLALKLQDAHIQKVLELKDKRAALEKERARPRPPAPKKQSTDADTDTQTESCPTCGQSMRFVQKYNRHWCTSCKKYGPKQ